jgi:hypothetical protein
MDPYFKPVLLSSIAAVLLRQLNIPIPLFPLICFCFGGSLAVYFFTRELINKDKFKEIKISDASILGGASGLLMGSISSLIFAVQFQEPEFKSKLIELINEQLRMNNSEGLQMVQQLGSSFIISVFLVTIFISAIAAIFGAIIIIPFFQKKKK